MRRTFGFILLELGLALVFLSAFLHFYVAPRVEKAPTDVYNKTISVGAGRVFHARSLSVIGPIPMENITISKGNPSGSNHQVAVISVFQRTRSPLSSVGDISYQYDVYAMDRASGYEVHCCGESPRHQGLTLKFPFGTKKITYPFYDFTAHKAFPANYVGTEAIQDVKTYVFVSSVPRTQLGTLKLPGSVAGEPSTPSVLTSTFYDANTKLWVDPTTGAIIKATQHSRQWAEDGGRFVTTLADTMFANDKASITSTADQVRGQLWQLRLVQFWLQLLGPIAGAVLMMVGAVLLRRPGATGPAVEPAAAPALAG